jgi:hypothetical protein
MSAVWANFTRAELTLFMPETVVSCNQGDAVEADQDPDKVGTSKRLQMTILKITNLILRLLRS